MNPNYASVAERARHRCEYCRAPEKVFNIRHEVEHIIPESVVKDADMDGLALACRSCNQYKSDSQTGPTNSGESAALFHPRNDRWDAHFVFEPSSMTIRGLTPTGEATVNVLRMNTPAQIGARRYWVMLEQYP